MNDTVYVVLAGCGPLRGPKNPLTGKPVGFSKIGVNPKKYFEVTDTRGCSMPNLVEFPPVVWAPNPNKQTNRQIDRLLGPRK